MTVGPAFSDQVVLVSTDDRQVGTMGKLDAHAGGGHLHRAVSVVLHDGAGQVLLQRRASSKYHFADLWSNACCTHPRPGESVEETAIRRCAEELGLEIRDPCHHGSFVYRADDPVSGLSEWEVDHVLSARVDGVPAPDPAEISDLRWLTWDQARREAAHGAGCTPWLPSVLHAAATTPEGLHGLAPEARP